MINRIFLPLLLSILAIIAVHEMVDCAVDESSPDLSMFNLRKTRRVPKPFQPNEPVHDPAIGAKYLRESLFVRDFQVRCISYAHLLKMIRARPEYNGLLPVQRDTIDSLAIVTDADRAVYYNLFKYHQTDKLPRLFQHAIEQIERLDDQDSLTRETWLELIQCAGAYFPSLKEFLAEPKRAEAKAQLEKFKAIELPQDQNEWEREGSMISVGRLRNKYEQKQFKFTDEEDLAEARRKVAAYDDSEAWSIRQSSLTSKTIVDQFNPEQTPVRTDLDQPSDEQVEAANEIVSAVVEEKEQPPRAPRKSEPMTNELLEKFQIMAKKQQARAQEPEDISKVRMTLSMLNFRGRRLEYTEANALLKKLDQPKLDIRTAIEYNAAIKELREMLKHNEATQLGQKILSFLNDPRNQATAEVMARVEKQYHQLSKALGELQYVNGVRAKEAKTMDELNAKYDKVLGLLKSFDPAFDTGNIMRALMVEIQAEKRQFNTLRHFIEMDPL